MQLVLNDLSYRTTVASVQHARKVMEQFLLAIKRATELGLERGIRVHENFTSLLLADGYTLAQWRNDIEVQRELKTYFRSILTASPYLDPVHEYAADALRHEFTFEGESAEGLGVAYLLDALSISLSTDQRWDVTSLPLDHMMLDGEALVERRENINHACRSSHLDQHADWIETHLRSLLATGADICDHLEQFPNLVFCDSVLQQLRVLGRNHPLLRPIADKLQELQRYCSSWQEGPFDRTKLASKASRESATTMDSYSAERTFRCPDGHERVFEWHLRITPGAWRLHFIPVAANRTVILGYIGPHLPTASDPT